MTYMLLLNCALKLVEVITVYTISQGRSRKVGEGAEESRMVSMELSVKLEFTVGC